MTGYSFVDEQEVLRRLAEQYPDFNTVERIRDGEYRVHFDEPDGWEAFHDDLYPRIQGEPWLEDYHAHSDAPVKNTVNVVSIEIAADGDRRQTRQPMQGVRA